MSARPWFFGVPPQQLVGQTLGLLLLARGSAAAVRNASDGVPVSARHGDRSSGPGGGGNGGSSQSQSSICRPGSEASI